MKELLIQPNSSIKKALKQMGRGAEKCLIVVNKEGVLLGTLSDGDLRTAILSSVEMNVPIENFYNKDSTFFKNNQYSKTVIKNIFIKNNFNIIPIVDSSRKVIDILKLSDVIDNEVSCSNNLSDVSVVIMAGGEGSRLLPFTNVLPKPLVPIKGKPILDHIIESFTKYGCSNFFLTLNYKKKILKAYFEEEDIKYDISFVDEDKPLGTAGSLKFLNSKIDTPFFVSNCDIIVKANYESIYDYHISEGHDITLVASAKEYVIPYGSCILNDHGHLLKIEEKPEYNFLVNAGLYVVNPSILRFIPKNKFYHITDLIDKLLKKNMKIGVFPIDEEQWIDVGEWAEYKKSIEIL